MIEQQIKLPQYFFRYIKLSKEMLFPYTYIAFIEITAIQNFDHIHSSGQDRKIMHQS